MNGSDREKDFLQGLKPHDSAFSSRGLKSPPPKEHL